MKSESRVWIWLQAMTRSFRTQSARRLRVSETVSLGERRFIAVVEYDQRRFLIGGANGSIALLTALDGTSQNQSETRPPIARIAGCR